MRRGSKTWQVFLELCDGLADVGSEVMHCAGRPSIASRYSYEEYMQMRSFFEKREKRQALRRLKQKQLIKIEKIGKNAFVFLTDHGYIESLRARLLISNNDLPSGQVCLVSFDIPEHVRDVRRALCVLLRKIGFECVQKSVWISHKNVVSPFKRYIEQASLNEWVRVFLAQEM